MEIGNFLDLTKVLNDTIRILEQTLEEKKELLKKKDEQIAYLQGYLDCLREHQPLKKKEDNG